MPFGVAAPPAGGYALVALGSTVGVVRCTRPGHVMLARRQKLPTRVGLGEALADGGCYLLVANGLGGAVVLDVSKTDSGRPGGVLGVLTGGRRLSGAIEVAVSGDGRLAFVTMEYSDKVAVFDLHRALTSGFSRESFLGTIPTGPAPVGMAVSLDGRSLYVTSVVWVTARGSDVLFGFSAALLMSDPRHALVAAVRVGEAPVGLALANGGSRIVVADSNRFNASGATATLAVINVPRAPAGQPSLLGYLRAGQFPRDMAVVPGGRTLLVSNYGSCQLQSVDLVAGLP